MAGTPASSRGGGSTDGWTADSNAWIYVSASSFKITGVNVTAQFQPGTLLKATNSTVKYFIVASSAFSTDTTVTLVVTTDYTLANAAISAPYYSYQPNPQGWPTAFNWTPTLTGVSSPSILGAAFNVAGRFCTAWFDVQGTSTAATFTATGPMTQNSGVSIATVFPAIIVDSGAAQSGPGRAQMAGNSNVITFGKTYASTGGFTASGTKEAIGSVVFPI